MPKPKQPDYTITDLAKELRITRTTVLTLIKNGNIKAYKIGNHYRVAVQEVEAFKQRNLHTPDTPPTARAARRGRGQGIPQLQTYHYKPGDKVV